MTRPTRHLRTRLLAAMVGIAFGVLVVAAVGAAAIARETSSDAAIRDLRKQGPTVADDVTRLAVQLRRAARVGRGGAAACKLIQDVLHVSGGSVVVITSTGTLEEGVGGLIGTTCSEGGTLLHLPRDLRPGDLQVDTLLAGSVQTGVRGGTAFLAEPLRRVRGLGGLVTPVVVLTQPVETRPLGRAGPYFFATGAFALVVAGIASALLARRLTRPIAAMQATARRIADGDFAARVGLDSMPNDELASLARSIDAMAAELETAEGHEREFLLSVSHDLRTPLTSIKGYAEAIADGVIESPPDRARAAGVIATEARRLERLVADLLDLARLDAHEFSLRPQPTDARVIVGATVQGFAPSAQEWGVRLHLTPGEVLPVQLDPERLAQVVANLVENALKYASSSVVVDVARADGRIELHVDDDGPGIPEAERERVFERLYTARGAPGRKVGTGIGLAIVYELAGAMGGHARCEPLDGGGTRFVVTIPET